MLLRLASRTGLVGQARAVPEALMFALALAVFGGYLPIGHRWPVWHRRRLRQALLRAARAAVPGAWR